LASVKHVVNRHAARLEVTSEPGSGSFFSVNFPDSRVSAAHGVVATPNEARTA
jgi:signal transduction histidine kinase